jgi:hypothetical protein
VGGDDVIMGGGQWKGKGDVDIAEEDKEGEGGREGKVENDT